MRETIKNVMRTLRLTPLNSLARKLRSIFYGLFDACGYLIFFPARRALGKRQFEKSGIRKILIIRLDRIGDLILSTPAIRAIREGFPRPNTKVHLLVSEYTKSLVVNNPHIDKLLVYHKDPIPGDYDLAIALHPGLRQNYLAFKSGARFRSGFSGWGGGFFLTHKIKDDRISRIRHEVDTALEIAGLLGCAARSKDLEVSLTTEGEKFAADFFKNHQLSPRGPVIVVHPGARQDYIRWQKEGFAQVCDKLIGGEKATVILIADKNEEILLQAITSLMTEKPLVASGLKLTELISLIKRCDLFIGNSTGPMHIAAALKVPVVAIFGSTHPLDNFKAWGPWGEWHTVVSKDLHCRNCHPGDCRDIACMKEISVDDVIRAVRERLKLKGRLNG